MKTTFVLDALDACSVAFDLCSARVRMRVAIGVCLTLDALADDVLSRDVTRDVV